MRKMLITRPVWAGFIALAIIYLAYRVLTAAAPDGPPSAEHAQFPEPGLNLALTQQPRPLPKLHFANDGGQSLTLADFRGKLILLNIWATWCLPCQEEMPALDRLQAMLGGPDFEVVALSVDRGGASVVKDFYQELGLEALQIFVDPSGQSPMTLNLFGIPTTLLIDGKGREIGRALGIAEWDSPEIVAVIRRYLDAASAAQPSDA